MSNTTKTQEPTFQYTLQDVLEAIKSSPTTDQKSIIVNEDSIKFNVSEFTLFEYQVFLKNDLIIEIDLSDGTTFIVPFPEYKNYLQDPIDHFWQAPKGSILIHQRGSIPPQIRS